MSVNIINLEFFEFNFTGYFFKVHSQFKKGQPIYCISKILSNVKTVFWNVKGLVLFL